MRVVKNIVKALLVGKHYMVVDYNDTNAPHIVYCDFAIQSIRTCKDSNCMYWDRCTRLLCKSNGVSICGLDDGPRRDWRELNAGSTEQSS